ncbi:MAG: NAD(P)/FAD-dependent oxidoreductase [Methanobacteriota archaeon]
MGGGVVGLGIAYELAKRGITDVCVLEQSYFLSGGSGRNGGGIRAQWSNAPNLEIAIHGLQRHETLAAELGYNGWFRQGGYLLLSYSEAQVEVLRENASLQNRHGIRTRILAPDEAAGVVPGLSTDGVVGAAFHERDGVVFPWPLVWGYLDRAQEAGVHAFDRTRVTAIARRGDRVTGVSTTRGDVSCGAVVNAAGDWSGPVARLAGVSIPNVPVRHEILATEPLKAFLSPMVVSLKSGLYFSQTMRGEIVGGIGHPDEPAGINTAASLDFLTRFARAATEVLPSLARVAVLRQWAGMYDMTPDARPILGPVDEVPNFFQANGFSGHGFMLAPIANELLAQTIAGEPTTLPLEPFSASRFAGGELETERLVIG